MDLDAGSSGGSIGPWVSWYASGSAKKRIQPQTWMLRSKDGDSDLIQYEDVTAAFRSGVVFDLSTIRLGYTGDDGGPGRAPTKQWAPTPNLSAFPNPEPNRKRDQGAPWWQETVGIRLAISRDRACTWEQAGFSAFEAFRRLVPLIKSQYAANGGDQGMHPVIQMVSVETRPSKRGQDAEIPVFAIRKWAPRPPCLIGDAVQIDMGAATPPAPPPPPATKSAPQPVAADLDDF
jgi:hypothetical protein